MFLVNLNTSRAGARQSQTVLMFITGCKVRTLFRMSYQLPMEKTQTKQNEKLLHISRLRKRDNNTLWKIFQTKRLIVSVSKKDRESGGCLLGYTVDVADVLADGRLDVDVRMLGQNVLQVIRQATPCQLRQRLLLRP